jgi:hypothetical protein
MIARFTGAFTVPSDRIVCQVTGAACAPAAIQKPHYEYHQKG